MLQTKNEYTLIQNQNFFADDSMSIASTLVTSNQPEHTDKVTGRQRSTSINSLCRRISTSIKRNFSDGGKSRRETRREKRPQDGKTNPME